MLTNTKLCKNRFLYFPTELWKIIKEFQINYKKHHSLKMQIIMNDINNLYGEMYERWTNFPPWANTNDIIRDERRPVPNAPNLPLTSICYNIKGNHGWWCGYGWKKIKI